MNFFPGTVSVTTRSCAQQDYSYQTFKRGHGWTTVTKVREDVYREGCFAAVGSDELRRHTTTYCYCSGDLCNSGHGEPVVEEQDGNKNDTREARALATSGGANIGPVYAVILTILSLSLLTS